MSTHYTAHVRADALPDATALLSTAVAGIVLLAFLAHRIAEYRDLPLIETLWNCLVSLMPARLLGLQTAGGGLASASTTHAAKSQALRSLFGLDRTGSNVPGPTKLSRGPKGLGNWDNSCYQNSVLQALSSVPSVASFLDRYDELSNASGPDSTIRELSGLMLRLNDASSSSTYLWTPPRLKSMNSWQQQDAQEYFARISDDIEKEFVTALRLHDHVGGLEALNSPVMYDSKLVQSKLAKSLVNATEGMLAQRVGCTVCGYVEGLSLMPFTSITLPLPNLFTCDVAECLDEFTRLESIEGVECSKCTVLQVRQNLLDAGEPGPAVSEDDEEMGQDTLTAAAEPQETSNQTLQVIDEALASNDFSDSTLATCGIPKSFRVSSVKTKQAVVLRPPQCLVLHFNRSLFDEYTGDLKKNYAAASYPRVLDLDRWCLTGDVDTTPLEEESWTTNPLQSMLSQNLIKTKGAGNHLYDLCAIVTHLGRHENGHYICFRRMPLDSDDWKKSHVDDSVISAQDASTWWRISDEKVSATSEHDVLAQEGAFMLFYEKRQHAVDIPLADSEQVPATVANGHANHGTADSEALEAQ